MLLHPQPISFKQLDLIDGVWVGEISSTRGFGRVYDDAADVGLTLVGDTEVVYVVTGEVMHKGELAGWELKPAQGSGPLMTLFND